MAPGQTRVAPTNSASQKRRTVTFDLNLASPYHLWGGIDGIARAAILAEEAGYFAVSMGERFVTDPAEHTWLQYDFGVLASHLATRTTRLRFINAAAMVPARSPVVQAKLWATLDQVSGGRVIFGVGLGSRELDADAMGFPFKERGAIADEYVRAIQVLWTEVRPSFAGRYVRFQEMVFEPKCVQQPHIPIWIAGNGGDRSMRRFMALHADGWLTNRGTPTDLDHRILWMKRKLQAAGRDDSKMTFGMGLGIGPGRSREQPRGGGKYFPETPIEAPEQAIDFISHYREQGINHVSLRFDSETPREYMSKMDWFAARVMPAFR